MPQYNKAGRPAGSGTTSHTRQAKRLAAQAAEAAATAATQAAQAAKAAAEAAEVAAALKKAAGLEVDEAQLKDLEEAAEAAASTATAAQAEAASQLEATTPVAVAEQVGSNSSGLAPVPEVKEEEKKEEEEEKKEEKEEVKEEVEVETNLEKGSSPNEGENEGKRKEPESGFVSHLHKNKGREVPKAAAKSRDSSRSSESSKPDYNRSSSTEPSSAPPSPGPPGPSKPLEKEDKKPRQEDQVKKPPIQLKPRLPGMVCLDWFKTVEQPNGELDTEPLVKLKSCHVKVWIVSWCGKSQARKVRTKCLPLVEQGLVEGVTCIQQRCGDWGKVALCKEWGLNHLFDDGEDICLEAAEKGMFVYPLLAGKPHAHSQVKSQYGVDAFWDLGDAVQAFLESHRNPFQ